MCCLDVLHGGKHGQLNKLNGVGQVTGIAPVSVRGFSARLCQPVIQGTHGSSMATNPTGNKLAEVLRRGPSGIWCTENAFENTSVSPQRPALAAGAVPRNVAFSSPFPALRESLFRLKTMTYSLTNSPWREENRDSKG
jgi:hypothetical protein